VTWLFLFFAGESNTGVDAGKHVRRRSQQNLQGFLTVDPVHDDDSQLHSR